MQACRRKLAAVGSEHGLAGNDSYESYDSYGVSVACVCAGWYCCIAAWCMLGLCAAIAAQARAALLLCARVLLQVIIDTGRNICQNIIAWLRCAPAQLQNTARLSLRAVPSIYYCGLRVTAPVRALATVTAQCSGSWRFWKAILAAVCSACGTLRRAQCCC